MDQKVIENDAYAVEATEGTGCRISVKVTVKQKPTQKAYQKALKVVNKQISIPGFRKGHAPDSSVISRYGSYVEQEWKDFVIDDAYRAALELTDIYPIRKESVEKPKLESCSLENGAVVHIAYEHAPVLSPVDFSSLKISSIESEAVSEEKIDEIIEEVRRSNANWEKAERPEVEEGDFVDISIDSLNEDPPKSIVKDRRFEVVNKRLPSWLKKLLIGLKIDESIEGESEVDEDADPDIKKNFKPTQVRITLHAIQTIILPSINDDLAKKAGAESIDDLRDKIRKNLEREAEDVKQRKRIAALEDALLEVHQFDLPASLVSHEKEERMTKRLNALEGAGFSEEEIVKREEEIEREIDAEVSRDLRLYFLNRQIAKQGKISLSNQELNEEFMRYLSQNPHLYTQERDEAKTREMVRHISAALMERKTQEYALAQITHLE